MGFHCGAQSSLEFTTILSMFPSLEVQSHPARKSVVLDARPMDYLGECAVGWLGLISSSDTDKENAPGKEQLDLETAQPQEWEN